MPAPGEIPRLLEDLADDQALNDPEATSPEPADQCAGTGPLPYRPTASAPPRTPREVHATG